jgi:hypothetical protein
LIDYLGFHGVIGLVLVGGKGEDVFVVRAWNFGGAKAMIIGLFVLADVRGGCSFFNGVCF